MADHARQAKAHLDAALAADDAGPWIAVGAAGVHALLHLADVVKHGLRDIIYELRD